MVASTSVTITILLSALCTAVEDIYQQLLANRTYQDQSIVFIVDRENSDFHAMLTNPYSSTSATTSTLCAALLTGNDSIIVTSRTIVAALYYFLNRQSQISDFARTKVSSPMALFSPWQCFELDDFCIFVPVGKDPNAIGLNGKNLKPTFISNITQWPYTIQPTPFAPLRVTTDNSAFLSKLFNLDKTSTIEWSVFLAGHGTSNQTIAGFSIREFNNILYFFDHKIKTKYFLYQSCFAGGVNKKQGFIAPTQHAGAQYQRQETYTFPVVMVSSANAVSFASININFNSLFKELITHYKSPTLNYFKTLTDSHLLDGISLANNFPQVRLPGRESFSVETINNLEKDPDYAIISNVMAGNSRVKDIKNTVKVILINAEKVQGTIQLPPIASVQGLPRLVWMVGDENTTYNINNLNAKGYNFASLCALVAPLSGANKTTIYFDSIELLMKNQNVTLNNALLGISVSQGYALATLIGIDPLTKRKVTSSAQQDPWGRWVISNDDYTP